MNIYKSELFPYIAGDSLIEKPVTLTIKAFKSEKVTSQRGQEQKYILYFEETHKGLILNKTNALRIAQAFGGETDKWAGNKVELYSERVQAFGATHNAARVRIPQNSQGAQ